MVINDQDIGGRISYYSLTDLSLFVYQQMIEHEHFDSYTIFIQTNE